MRNVHCARARGSTKQSGNRAMVVVGLRDDLGIKRVQYIRRKYGTAAARARVNASATTYNTYQYCGHYKIVCCARTRPATAYVIK